MNHLAEGIFDTTVPNFKIWTKKFIEEEIDYSKIIFRGNLLKTSINSQKLKERHFILTSMRMYCLKSQEASKIRAIMDTEFVRCEFIKDKTQKDRSYCVRFIKNYKYCDFYVKSEEEFNAWKIQLSKVIIQTNFHQRFRAIKMIGKGTFARVYLVEDRDTRQRYAVKSFAKEAILAEPKGKASLINEIQVTRNLKHPNIMNIEEIHETKNSVYIVMELLKGGELFEYIVKQESTSVNDSCKIMQSILQGLVYLADNKIIHRDLKPENIIIQNKGAIKDTTVKIVDFGFATKWDIPDYIYNSCGTPGYIAPEIINYTTDYKIRKDQKCDVFSAGIIFYILLTGSSPFPGHSYKKVLHLNKECDINYNHPRLANNRELVELLQRMLDTNPTKRLTARQVLEHKLFQKFSQISPPTSNTPLKSIDTNIKSRKNVYQKPRIDSQFVLSRGNRGMITGKTTTIKESCDDIVIESFKNLENNEDSICSNAENHTTKKNWPKQSTF
jgi:serine/threonine protein kinase